MRYTIAHARTWATLNTTRTLVNSIIIGVTGPMVDIKLGLATVKNPSSYGAPTTTSASSRRLYLLQEVTRQHRGVLRRVQRRGSSLHNPRSTSSALSSITSLCRHEAHCRIQNTCFSANFFTPASARTKRRANTTNHFTSPATKSCARSA